MKKLVPLHLALLKDGAREILGRPLDDTEVQSFYRYLDLLTQWQKIGRLVGSAEPGWIIDNLFLDSLLFTRVIPGGTETLLDLGSGAGIPGIPIKIVCREIALTFVEARQRPASFLSTAVRELRLEGARVVNARAENFLQAPGGRFQVVAARCANVPTKLIPLASQFLAPGGTLIVSASRAQNVGDLGEAVEVRSSGRPPRRFIVFRSR